MTRDRNYRKQGRAVFLTAIMVLSMVAVGFVAAPAAAVSDTNDDGVTADPTTVTAESTHTFNITIDSGDDVTNDDISSINVDYSNFGGSADTLEGIAVGDVTVSINDGSDVSTGVTLNNNNQDVDIDVGTQSVSDGDTIEVEIVGVTNPPNAEDQDVSVTLNSGTSTDDISLGLSLTEIDMSVDPASATIESDGTDDQTFTVTAADSNGDGIENVDIVVSDLADVDGANGQTLNTDIDGEATITTTSTEAGSYTIAFTEQASSVNTETSASLSVVQPGDYTEDDYDREIAGGETVFQGQLVLVDASGMTADDVELRRVDSSGDNDRVGELVSAPTVYDDGYVILDTENRQANEYVVTDGSRNAELENVDHVRFEVVVQDLAFELDDDEIDNEGLTETELEIDSEIRNDYIVNVSAEGLDYEDLEDIFTNADDATWNSTEDYNDISDIPNRSVAYEQRGDTEYYLDEDEDVIVLFNAEGTHDLDFEDITADEYELEGEVYDSTAEESDTIDVLEGEEGDVGFVETTAIEESGDIVAMELEFDDGQEDASVSVGELDEVGYQLDFTVDADGEDSVVVYFNSYTAGNESFDDDEKIWVDSDETDAEITVEAERGDEIDGLLDEGDYDVYVIEGDFSGADPADWDDEVIDNADDILLLTLTERSTDSVDVWTAPRGDAGDLDDLESISEAVEDDELTQADNIAKGDTMALEVGATGLSGILQTQGEDTVTTEFVEALDDGSFVLEIEQDNPQTNRRAIEVNVSQSADNGAFTVVPNAEEDTYYLVADTRNLEFQRGSGDRTTYSGATDGDLDMRDGANFDVEFSVSEEALLGVDDERRAVQADDDDDWETVETEFTFNDREAEFDDDPIEVYADADQELTGTTTLAPGTEITIRATATSDTQPRFVKTTTVDVASDRTVTGLMDFSEQAVDDEFEARMSAPDVDRDEVDGIVIEMEEEDTPDEDTPDEDTPDEDTPDEDTPDEDTPDEDTPTEEESPGFGIVVALVALIAAALLAVRRNDTL